MNHNKKTLVRDTKLPIYFPVLLISLLMICLTSCVLSPIYTQIENDVTVMYTVIPTLLNYLIIILESIYISLLFAVASYSVYAVFKGEESKASSIICIVSVIFLKHTLNLIASSVIDQYIDVTFDIPVTVMLFCVDAMMVLIVGLVAKHKCQKHFIYAKKMQKAAKYLNTVTYNEEDEIFPFKSMLNIKSPILFPIFVGAVISVSALVVQRLYADIFILGSPQSFFEIADIALSYLADILLGIIGYVAAYFSAAYIFIRRSLKKSDGGDNL